MIHATHTKDSITSAKGMFLLSEESKERKKQVQTECQQQEY